MANLLRVFGIGANRILASGCSVPGVVTMTRKSPKTTPAMPSARQSL